jgi:CBS domain-containing protein
MRALEIMSRPVITVHPWTPIREAAAAMTERAITALPVVDAEDRLVGIVSEGDLIWHRVPADPDAHLARPVDAGLDDPPGTVADVMTTAVVTMPTSANLADLAEAMLEYDVHSIPIVSGTAVVGIVSRRDVLRTVVRRDNAIAITVRGSLEEYCGHTGRWDVDVADGTVTVTGPFTDEAERTVVRVIAESASGVGSVELQSAGSATAPAVDIT